MISLFEKVVLSSHLFLIASTLVLLSQSLYLKENFFFFYIYSRAPPNKQKGILQSSLPSSAVSPSLPIFDFLSFFFCVVHCTGYRSLRFINALSKRHSKIFAFGSRHKSIFCYYSLMSCTPSSKDPSESLSKSLVVAPSV